MKRWRLTNRRKASERLLLMAAADSTAMTLLPPVGGPPACTWSGMIWQKRECSSSLSSKGAITFPTGQFKREYYYYINERGHLFHLYDTEAFLARGLVPSPVTNLKDSKTLDFFFTHLRLSPQRQQQKEGDSAEWSGHFPFLSRCGPVEANLVAVEPSIDKTFCHRQEQKIDIDMVVANDRSTQRESRERRYRVAPVVFHSLEKRRIIPSDDGDGEGERTQHMLRFAGTLTQPFDSQQLMVNSEGYLFHPLTAIKHLKPFEQQPSCHGSCTSVSALGPNPHQVSFLGVIGSTLCIELGLDYVEEEEEPLIAAVDERCGVQQSSRSRRSAGGVGGYSIVWEGKRSRIALLEEAPQ